MSLTVEITEQALSRERQSTLADLLVRTAGMEPDEAALTALVMPCAIGPMPSAEAQRSLLAALQGAGFAARAGAGAPESAYAPPAYAPPPPYQQPAYPQPAPGPYAPTAAGPYAPTPAPSSSNTALIAVAAVLGVAVIALAAILLVQDRGAPDASTTDPITDTPPGYGSGPIGSAEDRADSLEAMDDYVEPAYAEPVRSDGADYALGYSPSQGVNWSLFSAGTQTRYAAAPNRTPVPVRDAPSGRHGRVVADVPPGGAVQTDGCLPSRPEDGGRWCRTDYAGGEGWIYDRYLRDSAPAVPRPSPARPDPVPETGTSTANVPNIIVMGSYAPGDREGLDRRLAQAGHTGLALQVVPASNYGMNGDYLVIIAGPFDQATAVRLLGEVRRVVPDAFRKALD